MDPVSVLSIIGTCTSLCLGAGKLAVGLKSVAGQYKDAELSLRCLATECKAFAAVVGNIQRWMEDGPEEDRLDSSVWQQLNETLETADMVVSHCDQTMQPFILNHLAPTSKNKAKIVWNIDSLKEHEGRLRGQSISLGLLLQVINLSSKDEQQKVMKQSQTEFDDSKSSLEGISSRRNSIISTDSHVLQSQLRFSFDELLLGSRAYQSRRSASTPKVSEQDNTQSQVPVMQVVDLVRRRDISNVPEVPPLNKASTKSGFPHAFERWETLSSHWEGLTSYWVARLQENTSLAHPYELTPAVMARQITDLSAAGANLFHAVVELQRLRASSERKFQRWFFETRNELEQARDKETELRSRQTEEQQAFAKITKSLQERLADSVTRTEHEELQQQFTALDLDCQKYRMTLRDAQQDLGEVSLERDDLQSKLGQLQQGMEDIITQEVDTAIAEKNNEVGVLQNLLKIARDECFHLKLQRLKDKSGQQHTLVVENVVRKTARMSDREIQPRDSVSSQGDDAQGSD